MHLWAGRLATSLIRKSKDYVYGIWVYKALDIWKGYYRVKKSLVSYVKPWTEARNNKYMKYHSKLTYQLSFWNVSRKVDYHAGGKWFIHGPKRHCYIIIVILSIAFDLNGQCVCIFQPLDKFLKSFQSQILDKYKDNKTTMSEVTTAFHVISKSGFLSRLNNFQDNVSQAFDNPLNAFINSTVTSMKTVYPQMLDKIIAATHYLADQPFIFLGLNMQLWRIPVGIQPLHQT